MMGRWSWLALAVVVLFAATALPMPFYGDQALFSVMGERMASGDVLYADVWDPKQPATFAFYALGGTLFGFGEVGLHAFELLYWLAFAVTVLALTRRVYRHALSPVVVVLLSVATYYLSVRQTWIGQTEGLVAFPLFLAMWFVYEPAEQRMRPAARLVLAGVFSGIVLLFKLIFAPIVISFWVFALWKNGQKRQRSQTTAAVLGSLSLGAAMPTGLVMIYLLGNGALDDFLWTSFVYPIDALGVPGSQKPVSELVESAKEFARGYRLTGVLGLVGIGRFLGAPRPRSDWVSLSMLWLSAGSLVILIQRTAWWSYHFLLLFVPLALVGGYAFDWLVGWVRVSIPRLVAAGVVGLLLLASGVAVLVERTEPLMEHGFAIAETDRSAYRAEFDPDYRLRADYGSFLVSPGAAEGPIYVYGNPLYFYLSDRRIASSVHGWSTQFWTETLWERVLEDLDERTPPYVLMAREERVRRLHPETLAFLNDRYTILESDPELGTWYQLLPRE